LTHAEAKRYLHQAADGDLPAETEAQLQAHLAECAECRAYAEELRALETLLTHALRQRWEHRRPARDLGRPLAPRRAGWAERLLQVTRPLMQVSSFMIVFAFMVAMMQAYYRPQTAPTQLPAPESAPATVPIIIAPRQVQPAEELVDDSLARYPDSVVEAAALRAPEPLPHPRRVGGAIPN
jgi:anti-sigma factor RsiW